MNTTHKLYLSLGLLVSITSISYAHQEEPITHEIKAELGKDATQQEIDAELYDIFKKFFDEKDTTPFYKIIGKAIHLLKIKRNSLPLAQQAACDEIIKTLEKNRYEKTIATWANILRNPDLINLMSQETRAYIDSVSVTVKLKSLMYKLKNNNTYSFF
jgi:hypothetical protein